MTADAAGLGPVLELARAIGLVGADGVLDAGWFADPAGYAAGILRDDGQRAALLAAAAELLGPVTVDSRGRSWVTLAGDSGVTLSAVLAPVPTGGAEIGVGATFAAPPPGVPGLAWPAAVRGGRHRRPGAGVGLQAAAQVSKPVADLLTDRADVAAGLDAVAARWADTDGLVRAVDATLPGATVHDLTAVTHLALPEAAGLDPLSALTGVEVGAATVVATGPLGPDTWQGVAADHVLNLRAAGLAPEAFDLTAVAASDGPWLVLLSTRADARPATGDGAGSASDGAEEQAARLARVVDTVVAQVAPETPVAVVGYAAAGHAAAAMAGRA